MPPCISISLGGTMTTAKAIVTKCNAVVLSCDTKEQIDSARRFVENARAVVSRMPYPQYKIKELTMLSFLIGFCTGLNTKPRKESASQ